MDKACKAVLQDHAQQIQKMATATSRSKMGGVVCRCVTLLGSLLWTSSYTDVDVYFDPSDEAST